MNARKGFYAWISSASRLHASYLEVLSEDRPDEPPAAKDTQE